MSQLCDSCGDKIEDEDDVVWIDPVDLKATTGDLAVPYHVACAPPQHGRRCHCPDCLEAQEEDHYEGLRQERKLGDA